MVKIEVLEKGSDGTGKRKIKSELERNDVEVNISFPKGHRMLGNGGRAKLHRFRKPKFES